MRSSLLSSVQGARFWIGTRSPEYNRNGPEILSNKELNNAETIK
jgi:hypothetical protein